MSWKRCTERKTSLRMVVFHACAKQTDQSVLLCRFRWPARPETLAVLDRAPKYREISVCKDNPKTCRLGFLIGAACIA